MFPVVEGGVCLLVITPPLVQSFVFAEYIGLVAYNIDVGLDIRKGGGEI